MLCISRSRSEKQRCRTPLQLTRTLRPEKPAPPRLAPLLLLLKKRSPVEFYWDDLLALLLLLSVGWAFFFGCFFLGGEITALLEML